MSVPARGRPRGSPHASVEFLRAFVLALRDPATFDPRSNTGLWVGFVFAIPIPVLAIVLSASPWVVCASLVAPFAWSVVVGASSRLGVVRGHLIREMKRDALSEGRAHRQKYSDMHGALDTERDERARLASLQDRADTELALGAAIQQSLVPAGIKREDLDVALRHIPSGHLGGDYLQASLPRPDLLYLCVGDVAGHGVAAALVVSRIHSLVQKMILERIHPGPFLQSLNRATLEVFGLTASFMTFAVLRVELSARKIEYATAGHPAQFLLRRSGGDLEELFTPNRALGLEPTVLNPEGPVGSATYDPGDTLLLFTDGIVEVMGPRGGEIWGEERLRSQFVRLGRDAPEAAVAGILREVEEFRGASTFDDDVSLLIARLGLVASTSGEASRPPERVRAAQ